jgi:uncharacterized repeat protein (TIGR03803 family)
MKMTAALWLVVKLLRGRLFHIFAAVLDRRYSVALVAAVALPCLSSRGAAGTGVAVVHAFSQSGSLPPSPLVNADGASPGARMTLGSDGNLYGTTTTGGAHGAGIIFSLSPAGSLTDLYDFQGIPDSDGQEFYDLGLNELTAGPKGFYYGTTQRGGTNRNGTIFVWAPSRGEADVHVFSAQETNVSGSNPDGMNPAGALVMGTNGFFYGTTQYGGSNGNGTIFQLTPDGAFTSVYSFSALGGADLNTNADGATPNALALGTDGNFYGATQGGGANGAGEFFQFTISGALTPLYSFGQTDSDAVSPQAALAPGPNGTLYGTSQFGGTNDNGTIFAVTPAGVETVLYSFSGGNDGGLPNTALTVGSDGTLESDGNFYGTTASAGTNFNGTLFKITPAGTFTSLYSFAALNTNMENPIGAYPSAALAVGQDGNLYGTTQYGGANGNGTIFRYTNAAFSPLNHSPAITTQPPAKTNGLEGMWVTWKADAKGAPPLRAQWLKNQTNLLRDGGDISGSATGALVVGPLQAADAGSYALIVTNNFGAATSSVTILTVTPDTTPPAVAIVSPAANARTNSHVFNGTASDNARVTNVVWWLTNLNAGPVLSNTATLTRGGSNWSFAVTPFPGTNVLAVQSVDSAGLKSKTASQTFFYKVTNSLSVLAGGDGIGSFSGTAPVKNDAAPANNAALNVGEGYSIQAVAGKNSLFSNWVGSSVLGAFTNTGAAFSFVMQSNMVLTANFASNFFLAAHGTYNGLFYNTNAVAAESSGMLQGLLLGTNGVFSGQLLKAGTTYPLAGGFDVSGRFSTNIGPASASGGVLKINLAVNRAARQIVGTVSNTQWNATLTAEMAGTSLPSAEYTLLFAPSSNAPANTPPGDGYALATNHAGTVTFSGQLADGTAITPSAAESQNGDVPVYASLYGNTGLLLGWINLTNLEAAPPGNALAWIKKASRATLLYTNGFTNLLAGQGALWTNPPAKTPAIVLPKGQLVIASNANSILAFNVSVSNNNTLAKLAGSPTNLLTGSIAPQTGLLTLAFGNGSGKATTPGYVALLQTQTNGGGFFLGTTNAGFISLLPAP